ncbi:hypothetical protein PGTUg99_022867 [Puccinia graminis f. sp. tritici]|uniref:Uncharacterized protein n=1 Tax=Puccinia graminis f. sp. tritici TaxID=56615 RepID=A0A5B0M7L4_PUCGR|nr:hypothetical protein PGTUg99_022867 [Puccinia graminis f. sp. tritici]
MAKHSNSIWTLLRTWGCETIGTLRLKLPSPEPRAKPKTLQPIKSYCPRPLKCTGSAIIRALTSLSAPTSPITIF